MLGRASSERLLAALVRFRCAACYRLGPFGLGLGRVWWIFCNDQFWIGLGGGHWRWWNRVRLWQGWVAQDAGWIDADHACVGHRVLPSLGDVRRNTYASRTLTV